MAAQRLATRTPLDVAVTVLVIAAPEEPALAGEVLHCHTRNLSMSGLGLHGDRHLPEKSTLQVTIALGDPPSDFTFTGQVIWSFHEPGSGIYRTGVRLTALPVDNVILGSGDI